MQDITHKELIRQNPKCDRSVVVFGYLRGCNLRLGQRVHFAGVDDFAVDQVEQFPDPCPLPHMLKKRTLNEQERRIYAPMSDVGGLLYDKDATYIDIPDWKVQYTRLGIQVPREMQEVWPFSPSEYEHHEILPECSQEAVKRCWAPMNTHSTCPATMLTHATGGLQGEAMVREMQGTQEAVDEQLGSAAVQLFTGGSAVAGHMADEEEEEEEASEDEDEDDERSDDDSSSDWGSEDGNGVEEGRQARQDHRNRRPAVFAAERSVGCGDEDTGAVERKRRAESVSGDEWESAGEDEEQEEAEEDGGGDSGEGEEEEDPGNTARWRANMLRKQSALFTVRAGDLKRMVYGARAVFDPSVSQPADADNSIALAMLSDRAESESDDDDELFQLKKAGEASKSGDKATASARKGIQGKAVSVDALDSPYVGMQGPAAAHARWQGGSAADVEMLRHRIVTGGAAAFDDAYRRSTAEGVGEYSGEEGDDDEAFGDFEDMETGQQFGGAALLLCDVYDLPWPYQSVRECEHVLIACDRARTAMPDDSCRGNAGSGDSATEAAVKAIKAAKEEERLEALRAKKLAKKAAFDSEYDEGGAKAVKDTLADDDEAEGDVERADGDGKSAGKEKKKGKGWARCEELCQAAGGLHSHLLCTSCCEELTSKT